MKKRFFSALILTVILLLVVPASGVLACHPMIKIVKTTLGCDGKYGDGVNVIAGTTVTWKYEVSNIGESGSWLTSVIVTDNMGVTPKYDSGDDGDSFLEKGEVWIYYATGTAISGNYTNIGTASGFYYCSPYSACDPSSYFGGAPGINIDKTTNGGDGLYIEVGESVTWKYVVTNSGNVALSNITVTDSVLGVIPGPTEKNDGNSDDLLETGEEWVYYANGTAVPAENPYTNTGTASGSWYCSTVNDTDDSSYHNEGTITTETTPITEVGGKVYQVNQFLLMVPAIALGVTLLSILGIIIRRRMIQK